jgi:branched-chain amino acid transport system permease protein
MNAHDLAQQLIYGLSVGATYALIALGYTMVYGTLRLINFAHGDVYMVGAVVGFYVAGWISQWSIPVWLMLIVVLICATSACAVLGFGIERFAYRPLRSRPRLVLLITAIGVSLLLENAFQLPQLFGATPRHYPQRMTTELLLPVGFLGLTRLDVLSLSLSISLVGMLTWIVLRTRVGLALRAVSFRFDTATLMGINTDRIISFTFVFGSSLAAIAGVLNAIRYQVDPLMGIMWGLKAFIAAVLGGIGSVSGALLGGLVLGIVETLLRGYFLPARYSGYSDGAAFVILILILLFKPSGLLGKTTIEKV